MKKTTAARPTGLSILAVLAIVNGAIALALGIALNVFVTAMAEIDISLDFALPSSFWHLYGALGFTQATAALVSALFGALYLAWGIGAWRLRPWAWSLGMGIAGINLVGAISTVALAGGTDIAMFVGAAVVNVGVPVGLLFYLTRSHVKAALGR